MKRRQVLYLYLNFCVEVLILKQRQTGGHPRPDFRIINLKWNAQAMADTDQGIKVVQLPGFLNIVKGTSCETADLLYDVLVSRDVVNFKEPFVPKSIESFIYDVLERLCRVLVK